MTNDPGLRTRLRPVVEQVGTDSIGPSLLHGLIEKESTYRVNAVSPTGVRGLAQLTSETIEYLVDKYDLDIPRTRWYEPEIQIQLAGTLLQELKTRVDKMYPKASAETRLKIVLHAYNSGLGRVQKAVKKGGWNFTRFLPASSDRKYAEKVLRLSTGWVPTKTKTVVEVPRHNEVTWPESWFFRGPVLALGALYFTLWLRKMYKEFLVICKSR